MSLTPKLLQSLPPLVWTIAHITGDAQSRQHCVQLLLHAAVSIAGNRSFYWEQGMSPEHTILPCYWHR